MGEAHTPPREIRQAGRPRDDAVGPALLRAARQLVIRDGYRAVTIGAISEAAGVGRQTLYRRWPSKAELVLEAFLESAGGTRAPPGGPIEATLSRFLQDLFVHLDQDAPAIRSLIASAQEDAEFLASFRNRFVEPRAALVLAMLRAARDRGELAVYADLETAVEMIHGAFWYRLLQGEALDAAYAARLCRAVLRALL